MSSDLMREIEHEIEQILVHSSIPEDAWHAKNVREWILRLKPNANWALQIAALAHDIERAFPERKILRKNFNDYDAFKQAHADNSAKIAVDILKKYSLEENIIKRVEYLIRHHEFGVENDPDLIVLKDADSLSFFQINLSFYFSREGAEETLFRMKWGYRRLTNRGKEIAKRFEYDDKMLNELFKKCIFFREGMNEITLKKSKISVRANGT